jgi:hypothetical protein
MHHTHTGTTPAVSAREAAVVWIAVVGALALTGTAIWGIRRALRVAPARA